mgnify:CR=1 FL=1
MGLLLANAQAWDRLSADDHSLLAHLPAPHGAVFAWLEAQLHEHGPQPWAALREALRLPTGQAVGVIVSDSFGRPWRNGVVNVALGSAGIPALIDRRGDTDRHGRTLQITQTAFADAVAAGAAVVMGEGDEGMPVVIASGFMPAAPETDCRALVRPIDTDLFQ